MTDASEPIAKRIAEQLASRELRDVSGQVFQLSLQELVEVRLRAGWFRFVLGLRDTSGMVSKNPLMEGIISGGGRGVMPWLEGRIYPQLELASMHHFDARAAGLE